MAREPAKPEPGGPKGEWCGSVVLVRVVPWWGGLRPVGNSARETELTPCKSKSSERVERRSRPRSLVPPE